MPEPCVASKQGDLHQTGKAFDLAIDGHGFFKVTLPDGTIAYTRRGTFRLDANGNLVTGEGYLVDPSITLPEDYLDVVFSPDGTVLVTLPGSTQAQNVGTLELARFINPDGLKRWRRNGLFLGTAESGTPTESCPGSEGLGTVEQGYIDAQFASSAS
jgi:flagellar basal-body rod protein FlgG